MPARFVVVAAGAAASKDDSTARKAFDLYEKYSLRQEGAKNDAKEMRRIDSDAKVSLDGLVKELGLERLKHYEASGHTKLEGRSTVAP